MLLPWAATPIIKEGQVTMVRREENAIRAAVTNVNNSIRSNTEDSAYSLYGHCCHVLVDYRLSNFQHKKNRKSCQY